MVDTSPDLVGLRRRPHQQRSCDRVDSILSALVALVDAGADLEITTADIAEAADVPVGSLSEWFEDRGAVVDAAVDRMLRRHDEHLAPIVARPPTDPAAVADVLFDAYLQLYRDEPGFRALRVSGLFRPSHRAWVRERVEAVAGRVLDAGRAAGSMSGAAVAADRMALVMALGDASLQVVFRHDPDGDPALVAEARAVVRFALERAVRS